MRALAGALLLVSLPLVGPAAAAQAAEPLDEARRLLAEGHYDTALESARAVESAATQPAATAAARLLIGRIALDRYGRRGDPADLDMGREALARVDATLLSPRDQLALVLGLAQALYYEQLFGAAASTYFAVLERADEIGPGARAQVLDWWATALDRQAQAAASPETRTAIYERLLGRMETELQREPMSPVASYWVAAAARGAGDLEQAWNAAIAGWVRARFAGRSADRLRTDLDRLVTQGIIADRLRRIPAEQRNSQGVIESLVAEWESVKLRWP